MLSEGVFFWRSKGEAFKIKIAFLKDSILLPVVCVRRRKKIKAFLIVKIYEGGKYPTIYITHCWVNKCKRVSKSCFGCKHPRHHHRHFHLRSRLILRLGTDDTHMMSEWHQPRQPLKGLIWGSYCYLFCSVLLETRRKSPCTLKSSAYIKIWGHFLNRCRWHLYDKWHILVFMTDDVW